MPFGDRESDLDSIVQQAMGTLLCDQVMVTRGKDGLSFYKGGKCYMAPPLATKIIDTVGAGDAVLAISSLCVYSNCPPEMTAFLSAVSGALSTGILGNLDSIDKSSLTKFSIGGLK